MDIAEAYFKGKVKFNGEEYSINLQSHLKDKMIKLPFVISSQDKVLVKICGPNGVSIEELLPYKGKSEMIEIDSKDILHYVADHQDQFDRLVILFKIISDHL